MSDDDIMTVTVSFFIGDNVEKSAVQFEVYRKDIVNRGQEALIKVARDFVEKDHVKMVRQTSTINMPVPELRDIEVFWNER
jgi:hypothetical protein